MADEIKTQEETPEVYEKEGFWKTVTRAVVESKPGQWVKKHKKGFKIAAALAAVTGGLKLAGDWKADRGLFNKDRFESDDPGVIEDYNPNFSEKIQDISWGQEQSVEE